MTLNVLGSLGISSNSGWTPLIQTLFISQTGDGDAGDNYSVGVLKSTDGGLTFNHYRLNWN